MISLGGTELNCWMHFKKTEYLEAEKALQCIDRIRKKIILLKYIVVIFNL